MNAKLTAKPSGAGVKEFTLDCEHGITTALSASPEHGGPDESAIIAALVMKHYAEERCRCTRKLRRRYPPSLLPRTLWVTAR